MTEKQWAEHRRQYKTELLQDIFELAARLLDPAFQQGLKARQVIRVMDSELDQLRLSSLGAGRGPEYEDAYAKLKRLVGSEMIDDFLQDELDNLLRDRVACELTTRIVERMRARFKSGGESRNDH
jgi:hypothetical protein